MAASRTRSRPPHHTHADELFRSHAHRLERAVARVVNTSDAIVQDACAFAWLRLVCCRPRRETAFGWLRAVAIHEAIRLDRQARRDAPLLHDTRSHEPIELLGEVRDALTTLAALRPRQACMIVLQALGLGYEDISALTGDSHRTVERQLRRGRERLRALDAAR